MSEVPHFANVPAPVFELPSDVTVAGTCGACGGPMLIPVSWGGSPEVYPVPVCGQCGRKKKAVARWGPVIEVEM